LAAQGVLRGASDYTTPLWILLGANVANLVIELVFVFVFDLGVAGSAWSTVISQLGAALAFLWILRPRIRRASVRRPSRSGINPLMTAGRHLLLRVGAMLVVFIGSTAVAARIDEPTLAAHQIVMSMFLFLALTLDALAIPAQTLVAAEFGKDDKPLAAHISNRSVRLSIATGALLGVLLAALSPALPHLFSSDSAVTDRATGGLLWLAVMLIPGAIAFAYDGVLIGAGDYRFLGRAAVGYLVVAIPIAIVTLLTPQLGIAGIWGGLLAWMVVRSYVNHLRAVKVLQARSHSLSVA
jgi:putative MATE family efflux protein